MWVRMRDDEKVAEGKGWLSRFRNVWEAIEMVSDSEKHLNALYIVISVS